jgi:hypothetical protein
MARILIPSDFSDVIRERQPLDDEVTTIVAATEEDIPSAQQAQELLGAGQILLGAQPPLSDVILAVGRGFSGGK